MRPALIASALVFFLSLSTSGVAAPCKPGASVTLEGEIIIPPVVDGEDWFWPGKFAGKPCQVITLRGKGALPPECVVGKRMALTGRVIEDGILFLEATHIRCF